MRLHMGTAALHFAENSAEETDEKGRESIKILTLIKGPPRTASWPGNTAMGQGDNVKQGLKQLSTCTGTIKSTQQEITTQH